MTCMDCNGGSWVWTLFKSHTFIKIIYYLTFDSRRAVVCYWWKHAYTGKPPKSCLLGSVQKHSLWVEHITFIISWISEKTKLISYMGLITRKPVFGMSDKAGFKPVPQLQSLARILKFHLQQSYIWYFLKSE